MDYIIEGGHKLDGEISVYGAKNCALALLGATVLTDDEVVLTNCPQIVDVENMLQLLKSIGKKVWRVGDVVGVAGALSTTNVTTPVATLIRGSILILGSVLARYGNVQLPLPGGCAIGSRPIDIHLDGLRAMGVAVNQGLTDVVCCGVPQSTTYKLRFASVGATQNLICASVFSKGKTVLKNCAIEPEIVALERLLVSMGAKISGIGCSTVTIEGVQRLHTATAKVIPDRIVTATYLSAVVCAKGKLVVENCNPRHLRSFLQLISSNFPTKIYNHAIAIEVSDRAKSYGFVRTAPYPFFPTDMQSLLLSMACFASGSTCIKENLFENRLSHNVKQLNLMGAKIAHHANTAIVDGVNGLTGTQVSAMDLRGGAGLVVAGLGAQGTTIVRDVSHIQRGYINLAESLASVGANITILNESAN